MPTSRPALFPSILKLDDTCLEYPFSFDERSKSTLSLSNNSTCYRTCQYWASCSRRIFSQGRLIDGVVNWWIGRLRRRGHVFVNANVQLTISQ